MIWAVGPLIALAGAIVYWLLILSEGVYLGTRVVIALYDGCASEYDQIKQVVPHEDADHLARPLLAALRGVDSPLILDIAVGTGRLPLALLRQWDFTGRVVGLDLSRRMLQVGRRRTYAQRHRVGLIREDAMTLPFPAGAFDAVTCVETLELLPRPQDALAEMVRVLRPGGQLLVTNRVGLDVLFFPGRAYRSKALEKMLHALGLANVRMRRWQVHYDLIEAQKLLPRKEPALREPHLGGASTSPAQAMNKKAGEGSHRLE